MTMRFSLPNFNVVASDEGFSVEILGQTGVKYVEEGKSLFVDSEVLMGPAGLVVFPESIQAWEPPNDQAVSDRERERIVDNIRRAFRFRGFDIQVVNRQAASE